MSDRGTTTPESLHGLSSRSKVEGNGRMKCDSLVNCLETNASVDHAERLDETRVAQLALPLVPCRGKGNPQGSGVGVTQG